MAGQDPRRLPPSGLAGSVDLTWRQTLDSVDASAVSTDSVCPHLEVSPHLDVLGLGGGPDLVALQPGRGDAAVPVLLRPDGDLPSHRVLTQHRR